MASTHGNPLTVACHSRARIEKIYYDPFQMIRTVQMLVAAGFPCEHSIRHLTSATENLLSLFTSKGLRLYPHGDLREHCLNSITVGSAKGIRLVKEKQSAKIDVCAALSFACLAAVQAGRPPGLDDLAKTPEWKTEDSYFDPRFPEKNYH